MRVLVAALITPIALSGCFIPDRPTPDLVITTDSYYMGHEAVRNVRVGGRAHDVRIGHLPFMYEWYGKGLGEHVVTFDVGAETVEAVVEATGTPAGFLVTSGLEFIELGNIRLVEGPRLASPEGRPALRVNVLRSAMLSVIDVRLDGVKADEFEEVMCPVWTWQDLEPGKYSLTVETGNGTVYDQTIEVLESGGALIYGVDLVSADEDFVIVIDDAVRIDPPFDFDEEDGDVPGVPDYVRLWVP